MGRFVSISLMWSCPCQLSVGKQLDFSAVAGAMSNPCKMQRSLQCKLPVPQLQAGGAEAAGSLRTWSRAMQSIFQLFLCLHGMQVAYLNTASIEADFLTNLPAFLQSQLLAFHQPCFHTISARISPRLRAEKLCSTSSDHLAYCL